MPHDVPGYDRAGIAVVGEISVPVRIVDYTCQTLGQTFVTSKAPDWRSEARLRINLRIGQDPRTRRSGLRLVVDHLLP